MLWSQHHHHGAQSNAYTHGCLAVSASNLSVHKRKTFVQVPCVTLLVQHGRELLPRHLSPCRIPHVLLCWYREKMGPAGGVLEPMEKLLLTSMDLYHFNPSPACLQL